MAVAAHRRAPRSTFLDTPGGEDVGGRGESAMEARSEVQTPTALEQQLYVVPPAGSKIE